MNNKIKFGRINKIKIDHTKIKTIEDVSLIIKHMRVEVVCLNEEDAAYQELKHLLDNTVTTLSDKEVDALKEVI